MYKIICVGKIKEDFLVKGINEYTKRISGFTKLEIIEVKEINTSDINNNINEEGNLIIKKINTIHINNPKIPDSVSILM